MDPTAAKITAGELVVALSHYDLGAIESVRRFRGGSRSSPKIVLETESGRYLLKRRPTGVQSQRERVAFTHEVVGHLSKLDFPVPRLIATRSGATMLELHTGVYELYRHVTGTRYARLAEQALGAGWWLGKCHAALGALASAAPTPARSFHAHPKMVERINAIPGALNDPGLRSVCRSLGAAYAHAAESAERESGGGEGGGGDGSGTQVIHGDWHPGNMLFAAGASSEGHSLMPSRVPTGAKLVVGLFDFDSARRGAALHDLANGAMQFAVHRHFDGGESSDGSWRIALDPTLFRAFFAGYEQAKGPVDFRTASVRAVPWLMIEALIVEAAVPIANTGRFGKLSGKPVLGVVQRAAEALAGSAEKLVELAAGGPVGTSGGASGAAGHPSV